jgi:hypothetical protein
MRPSKSLPTNGSKAELARISHTPFCGESRRRARVGFPPALASRHFWIGVAGLNRLQRAFENSRNNLFGRLKIDFTHGSALPLVWASTSSIA